MLEIVMSDKLLGAAGVPVGVAVGVTGGVGVGDDGVGVGDGLKPVNGCGYVYVPV